MKKFNGFKAEPMQGLQERDFFQLNVVQAVDDAVTMGEVIARYTPELRPQYHESACPICGGSFGFCYTDDVFSCTQCGTSGKPVDFVQHVCGLDSDFSAARRIISDFRLAVRFERTNYRKYLDGKQEELTRKIQEYKNQKNELTSLHYCNRHNLPYPNAAPSLPSDYDRRLDGLDFAIGATREQLYDVKRKLEELDNRKY